MKTEILDILRCPQCNSKFTLRVDQRVGEEIRAGQIVCNGHPQFGGGMLSHHYDVEDGIIRFCQGFSAEIVQKEIEYENTTYHGSDRLTDPKLIAGFPDTLTELWPHTAHFGPDFRELIDRIDVRPGDWVLDIGTGPCWSSRLLAQRGARVIALDVNEANFYGLKTSDILFSAHNVYFERVLESMTHLPFGDGTIDRITFNASFHHTPDHDRTLAECFRVLKPHGMIAMVNEEFGSLRQRLFCPESTSDTGSHHRIEYAEFDASVKKAGFEAEFYVAEHVRKKLNTKFSVVGDLVVHAIESVPLALKQLNSALIVLKKQRSRRSYIAPIEQLHVESGTVPMGALQSHA
ncbi:MAG: type 11 methyltransferase [Verrucomicrobiales bacterium]|nr:type 11 methyltransferase [Verrucomicrobiales bacterium]